MTLASTWGGFEPPPSAAPPLFPAEVHVWAVDLSGSARRERELLAPEERERAERFRFDRHRDRFTAARGALRSILGAYVGRAPRSLRFAEGAQGKPELPDAAGVHFNVSHSEAVALIAVGSVGPLGVDVEWHRPLEDLDELARRNFSARENARLAELAEERRAEAFFTCWTRKEAFVKALGEGLSHPLDSFDVTLAPGEPARFLEIRSAAPGDPEWRLHELVCPPRFSAALVTPAPDPVVRCWRWPRGD